MTARDILMAAGGDSQEKQYVDDVFSTYLYDGSGATKTINNGIDLADKGGLVWVKSRSTTDSNSLFDTTRGATKILYSDLTYGESVESSSVTAFNSNGFNLGATVQTNRSGASYLSWTFRKAPKFFDCGTYTGNGMSGRQITHLLGTAPGMVIVKSLNVNDNWLVYHRSVTTATANGLYLNTPAAADGAYAPGVTEVSSNTFTVNDNSFWRANAPGREYVWYAFAHDPSADGLIRCGSFTTDSSGSAAISLGWEPQFVLLKASSAAGNWVIVDSMRGMPVGGADAQLYPHVSNAEASINTLDPTATGFNATELTASTSYIYMAIRRPNKPPTTGGQVYNAITYSGKGVAKSTMTGVGFTPDTVFSQARNTSGNNYVSDRLRSSSGASLLTSSVSVENTTDVGGANFTWLMDGITYGGNINIAGSTYINRFFRRAPGFMDVVCYTGDNSVVNASTPPRSIPHSLGSAPGLIIVKSRTSGGAVSNWMVGSVSLMYSGKWSRVCNLNSSGAAFGNETYFSSAYNDGNTYAPGSSKFTIGTNINTLNVKYVAYLFATLPGISKVGSYIGNDGSQTINCGFSSGARFVLIKRKDAAGDWYVWDTARGIVGANDPHLSLNSTAAEVTTDDSVDPYAPGFIVNQNSATNINVSGNQYIFLAIA